MPSILPNVVETTDAASSGSTSYALAIGQTAQGTISSSGDHDWFRTSLVAGQTYTFAEIGTGTNSLRDPYLYLRNSTGAIVASDDNSGPGYSSSLTYTATATGTYYVDAAAYGSGTGQYGVTATLGTKPNFDIPMGAGALDSYCSWSTPGTAATVSYGFRQSAASYTAPGSDISTFTPVSSAQMTAVQSILQIWSDVCRVSFVPVNPGGYTNSATILIGDYTDPNDGAGAFAYYPGSTSSTLSAGDLWLNTNSISRTSLPVGSYSFFAILHELGHALGLSHPGDYNAAPGVSITYSNSAQFVQDSEQYSVMSYFGGASTGASPGGFAAAYTPMMFDIYELQQIYGANTTTRAGDNTYGFGSTAGSIYDFTAGVASQFCIWDAGGNDTLNCSGYSQNQVINLNEGTFSNIGGGISNISIALGAIIENAIGGSGNDVLIGNAANNVLDGGAGYDRAAFSGVRSAYTVSTAGGVTTVDGPGGHDTLTNIEFLRFDDLTMRPNLSLVANSDFNGSGASDILWLADDGRLRLWDMSGSHVASDAAVAQVGTNWHVAGTGDFNGDGRSDILWRSDDGSIRSWTMSGTSILADKAVAQGIGANWHTVGIDDFNGDGQSDILWRANDGSIRLWQMNNGVIQSDRVVGPATVSTNWHVVGTGDFDGDHQADLLWRSDTGDLRLWEMNGAQIKADVALSAPNIPTNWRVDAVADYSGDGKADIIWHADDGHVRMWVMDGPAIRADLALADSVGRDWTVNDSANFSGTADADLLWRAADGRVRVWDTTGTGVVSDTGVADIATNWHIVNHHYDLV